MKPNCLYAKGMRPLMYSEMDFQKNRKNLLSYIQRLVGNE
jgi:hypothetical protein